MRVGVPEYVVGTLIVIGSCPGKVVVPPVNLGRWDADCRAIYKQELGRDADPSGLVACEQRMASAIGPVPAQEQFRAWVREQPEWAQHQQDLADAAEAAKTVTLPRLRGRGQFIEQDTGSWFTLIEATDFALYQRHLEHDPGVDAVLDQRRDLGFNSVRIFGVSENTFPGYALNLTLTRYGDRYYTELAPFFQRLAKRQLYASWVAFISNGEVAGEAAQLAHWTKLVTFLQPIPNVLLSAINEDSAHPQSRLQTLFTLPRPVGVFSSHGSNGGTPDGVNGMEPPLPHWDWIELHTNDTFERQRKVGHNCQELSTVVPCVASENTRADDRLTRTSEAFDSAAGAALLAGGSTFHSVAGRISVPFEGAQLELAKAWVAGAKSVPLSCQAGDYRHGAAEIQEEAQGNYLRVYQRGADPGCRVRIRK